VILAFDTAGPVVGVALWTPDGVEERVERIRRGAETRLVPWAQELLDERDLSRSDIRMVAVSHGPGAFTGIRVGLAAAAGVAEGLGVPLWGRSSLDSRAARAGRDGEVLAMLDARKGRVYAALYRDGRLVEGPGDVAPEVALSWPSGSFVATGEGAVVYADRIEGGSLTDDPEHPAVGVLASLAAVGLRNGEGADPATVVPVYLRAPDAKPPRNLL